MNGMMKLFKFVRANLCTLAALLAVNGFLLLNSPSFAVLGISAAAFCAYASLAAYNNITDKREDAINRKSINPLSASPAGKLITVATSAASIVMSYFISISTTFVCLSILATGIAYSKFRIKKYPLVKNIYTAIVMSAFFFMGATDGPAIPAVFIVYFAAMFAFFMAGSIVSDVRDYEGDRKTGIKTLSVLLGLRKSKLLIAGFVTTLAFFTIAFGLWNLYTFTAIAIAATAIALSGRPHIAHTMGGLALIALTLQLVIG